MDRFKKHRVKTEKPETSSSYDTTVKDYDLTYYIHDRVELMHQVFSVLRHKDLKAMSPECVRHISIDDLQELCTEELLGISSKRLCAILDGAEPPSDTESSSESPERLETISLDSISSDDEILSESSSKKNKKHKRHHRNSKTKTKKKKPKDTPDKDASATGVDGEQSRAARAGLTVLELLELQARARAIRAQLQQEQAAKKDAAAAAEPAASSRHSSDTEVEIKEEPAEVVEISSEDEKPDVEKLKAKPTSKEPIKESTNEPFPTTDSAHTVTKRISDLIITVPQTKQSRKIKLNRTSKITVSVPNNDNVASEANTSSETAGDNIKNNDKTSNNNRNKEKTNDTANNDEATKSKSKVTKNIDKSNGKEAKKIALKVKKQRKKDKKKAVRDSDDDEITLQLSDTEKMDLLEDLDRKNFENVSSSGSEDSESSSSDSSDDLNDTAETTVEKNNVTNNNKSTKKDSDFNKTDDSIEVVEKDTTKHDVNEPKLAENASKEAEKDDSLARSIDDPASKLSDDVKLLTNTETCKGDEKQGDDVTESPQNNDVIENTENNATKTPICHETSNIVITSPKSDESNKVVDKPSDKNEEVVTIDDIPVVHEEATVSRPDSPKDKVNEEDGRSNVENKGPQESAKEREMSDGEVSEKTSSDIEAHDLKPEVVCISDTEETDTKKKKSEKKKKKKDKKSKSKKLKKTKSDFRESGDQNFYEESQRVSNGEDSNAAVKFVKNDDNTTTAVSLDDNDYDDVYEILELSDDSSCYEVEGTVLSKEPTAEEIEALSAKIDEIEREDVVTEEEIRNHERNLENENENMKDLEKISWKDRYLDSKKVKRVLTTSNIFNALRKKNRELKKKLEESKKEEVVEPEVEEKEPEIEQTLEEGSIEQFNTLQGLTKYVNPVPDPAEEANKPEKPENAEESERNVETAAVNEKIQQNTDNTVETPQKIKEMGKDAKLLLKMYKKLLKYNDMNKQKDPNKKKKKKKKKNKDGGTVIAT